MAKGFMIPAVGAPNSDSGGGGNITVEALTATENKTYTAPEGKAYSPVTVNVSGGSSDFSTIKVTVNLVNGGRLNMMAIDNVNGEYPMIYIADEGTYDVVTYNGFAIGHAEAGSTITVNSGSAEAYESDLFATGNCEITVTRA